MKQNKLTYLVVVIVIAAAFLSFSSCKGCVNTNANINIGSSSQSGSISVNILGIPKPQSGTKYMSIAVNGIQISGSGGTGRTSFSDPRTYEVTPSNINPQPLITREALKPGRWRVTVSADNWSANAEGNVGVGKSVSFTFTYNTNKVTVQ